MNKLLIILVATTGLISCGKQIENIRPINKIDKEGQLSSVSGVMETTIGNYTMLAGNSFAGYSLPYENISEGRGNNVTLREFGNPVKETDAFFFQNSNAVMLGYSSDFFRAAYQAIVSVNTALEGVEVLEKSQFGSLKSDEKNNLLYAKGENMFIRAFTYFNLVRMYGKPYYQNPESSLSVPLKLTSEINDIPSRASVKEVYDFIVSDLKTAAQLMKSPVTKTNSFISTGAAWALLSRVYLYMGGSIANPDAVYNGHAITYADSVINFTEGKYALLEEDAYKQMFGDDETGALGRSVFANNKEIIFAYNNAVGGTGIGGLYHFDRFSNRGGIYKPSSDFMQLLAPNDIRGSFFKLNPYSNATETTKWLVLNQSTSTRAPQIYLRIAEVYLNRAEAYAKINDYANAKLDLKKIHTRAGLSASGIDGLPDHNVLAAILQERRIEMAFEGHAGYDYFRNGLSMIRKADDYNGTELIVTPDDPKVVFTIPSN